MSSADGGYMKKLTQIFIKTKNVPSIMNIECSNSAYERLQAIGIYAKARLVKEDLKQIFLHRTIWQGKSNQILEEINMVKQSGAVLTEEQKDILSLESRLEKEDFILQIEPFTVEHPFLVANIVLGNDLDNFSQYGFDSKKNLAGAVNTYCIGERDIIDGYKRNYIWRQKEYKNKVELMDHGDLFVKQTDVSGKKDSGVLTEPSTSGFGLEQDWSPFLISVLKYAQTIGKQNLPEIKNWQELINELRTSNPWGNDYSKDFTGTELHLNIQFNDDLFVIGSKHSRLWINRTVLPYVNEGALDFLRRSENGELEFCIYREPEKFDRVAHYIPEDIPHLLKANYQLYARNIDDMTKIMYWFNNK